MLSDNAGHRIDVLVAHKSMQVGCTYSCRSDAQLLKVELECTQTVEGWIHTFWIGYTHFVGRMHTLCRSDELLLVECTVCILDQHFMYWSDALAHISQVGCRGATRTFARGGQYIILLGVGVGVKGGGLPPLFRKFFKNLSAFLRV